MTNKSTLNKITSTNESTVVYEFIKPITRSKEYQSELELEQQFINQLSEQGYEYIDLSKIDENKHEEFLINNLRDQLSKLNNYNFTDNEWNKLFNNYIANKQENLKDKTQKIQENEPFLLVKDDESIKNIYLIDKNNIHNNKLQVINQFINNDGLYKNRYDVTILVNGLPLIHIELKKRGIALKEAFNQINRYKRDSFFASNGLFEYIQIFVISNGTETKYYSNTTRHNQISFLNNAIRISNTSNSFEFTNYWSDSKNQIITDLEDFTKTFFAKHTILNILTKYMIFTVDKNLIVMRPYQIVATESILNKIQISYNYPKQLGTIDAGGYIWHTTGSGKTVTSFKTAQLATNLKFVDKVIFVVDRKDLDYQTITEYEKFKKGSSVSASSSKNLEEQLLNDDSRILITTIQKLSIFINKNPKHPIFNKHVVLIFDECHRSQFGEMHQAIINNFKKYNIFGFTGTPIFARNLSISLKAADEAASKSFRKSNFSKTTEQLFGNRLHTYTIIDAINDKNVLPFKYNEIKTFTNKDSIQNIKVSGINTERVWLAPQRIEKITAYILDNFNINTYRNQTYSFNLLSNISEVAKNKKNIKQINKKIDIKGFNSIFAVSSIEAAKLYYSEFKKQLQNREDNLKLNIALIYSFSPNETLNDNDDYLYEENNESAEKLDESSRLFLDKAIEDYNEMFGTSYNSSAENFQTYYKDVSLRLKNKEIDILIVVNMFLTGFDATTLNTLWVDKNLKMHGLIQAFSRTNRILNSVKKYGNIVSFRPLEKELKDAISLFSDNKASGILILRDYNDYFYGYKNTHGIFEQGFEQLIQKLIFNFSLNQQIQGESKQKEFVKLFGKILQIRNILLTWDEFLSKSQEIISDRDFSDYLGKYQDIYYELKNKEKSEKVDIIDDLVFEIELVKHMDISIDYMLYTISQNKDKNIQDKEFLTTITKMINSSNKLRSKKELILNFLQTLYEKENIDKIIQNVEDIAYAFNAYKKELMIKKLEEIVQKFNLNKTETEKYLFNSCQINEVKRIGTVLNKIMPPTSRFNKGNFRLKLKEQILEEFDNFVNDFCNL